MKTAGAAEVELIKGLKEHPGRSEEAFRELVQRYGTLVYGSCYRILRNHHDAEDATQIVFTHLLQKAYTLNSRQCMVGWLHRVAGRVAISLMRSNTRTEKRDRNYMNGRLLGRAAAGPAECCLDEAVDALPDHFRLPLLLHHFDGKTQEEVAELLGEQVGTISSRLTRGRELLRERLERCGVIASKAEVDRLLSCLSVMEVIPLAVETACFQGALAAGLEQPSVGSNLFFKVSPWVKGGLKTMMISKVKALALVVTTVGLSVGGMGAVTTRDLPQEAALAASGPEDLSPEIKASDFGKIHKMVLPEPGVEWEMASSACELRVEAARQRAAREGKPLLIFMGGGGGGQMLGFT